MRIIKPEIIYEDSSVIVCRKPAGIPVQTSKTGMRDMVSILKNYRSRKKEDPYIGVVHRLDQPVEGVMVFAKTNRAAADLSRQIASRSADKYYLAVADGIFEESQGEMTDWLLRDGRKNVSEVVPEGTPGAKKAVLSWKVLAREKQLKQTLLEINLHTGRHHQIRVQTAAAGHPLEGDRKYNPSCSMSDHVALCSFRIGFDHPETGKHMEFSILPVNTYFRPFGHVLDEKSGSDVS